LLREKRDKRELGKAGLPTLLFGWKRSGNRRARVLRGGARRSCTARSAGGSMKRRARGESGIDWKNIIIRAEGDSELGGHKSKEIKRLGRKDQRKGAFNIVRRNFFIPK